MRWKITLCIVFLVCMVAADAAAASKDTRTWLRMFGGTDHDALNSITQTADGNYIAGGYTSKADPIGHCQGQHFCDLYIIKLDPSGNLLWERAFGSKKDSEYVEKVVATDDGGAVVAALRDRHVVLVRLNAAGEIMWERSYGKKLKAFVFDMRPINDGGFVLTGPAFFTRKQVDPHGRTGREMFVMRVDKNGKKRWLTKLHDDKDLDSTAEAIVPMRDGSFVVVGETNADECSSDMKIVKLDAKGRSVWKKVLKSKKDKAKCGISDAAGVQETRDGGVIVLAYTEYGIPNRSTRLLKFDASGKVVWNKYLRISDSVDVRMLMAANGEGYLLAGSKGAKKKEDSTIWTAKVDGSGELLWQKTLPYYDARFHKYYSPDLLITKDGGIVFVAAGVTELGQTYCINGCTEGVVISFDSKGACPGCFQK